VAGAQNSCHSIIQVTSTGSFGSAIGLIGRAAVKPQNWKDSKPLVHGAELSALLWGLVAATPRCVKIPG
jgi:hypothetical protein